MQPRSVNPTNTSAPAKSSVVWGSVFRVQRPLKTLQATHFGNSVILGKVICQATNQNVRCNWSHSECKVQLEPFLVEIGQGELACAKIPFCRWTLSTYRVSIAMQIVLRWKSAAQIISVYSPGLKLRSSHLVPEEVRCGQVLPEWLWKRSKC